MTNQDILNHLSLSFEIFLGAGSRSNKKLINLHGAIAADIALRLGGAYSVYSLGHEAGKEKNIQGRYIDKKVDITICSDERVVAGIGVKFVMNNYAQNSNNYFESMLGETANIRCAKIPYFQIFVIPNKMPYFNKNGDITHWEGFSAHNAAKYITLSSDNTNTYFHSPNKTLIYTIDLPPADEKLIKTKGDYIKQMSISPIVIKATNPTAQEFGTGVILNDYELFAEKVYHAIKAL